MPAEIVVTGASGALGAAVVKMLAAAGHHVIAIGRAGGEAKLAQAVGQILHCRTLSFDLGELPAWESALKGVEIAGAVLTAGGWKGGARLHEPAATAAWREMLDANLESAHVALQAVLPPLVARRAGSVVVVGSRAALRPWESAGAAAYAASKAALMALVQAIAAETLNDGVRVNAVLPSTIDTGVNRQAMPGAKTERWVSTDSLAGVIGFLLSDDARDISGALIPVYGRA
ncbi:MAG TPA: SDR family NAD(P)-dependent oxidoreductase [Polyangiaceae bacterium]|jgi:NAD(P)-dependent dehydrogenase (short-subunit alcohol dehydrogenase family)